jgi:hypothetical protein
MQKMPSFVKWLLPGVIGLGLLGGLVLVSYLRGLNHPHIPPCEAMRPYLLYHGTYYYEIAAVDLPSSDRGSIVTTIGDGPSQAHSCLDAGPVVYSVKGRPSTTDLALDSGDGLVLFEVPSAAPSPTAPTSNRAWMPQFADASVVKSLDRTGPALVLLSRTTIR